ncbi:MAG: HesB/IscA family protein [Acidimicrobiales bacterium]
METVGTTIELTPTAAAKIEELRGDDATKSFLRLYVAGRMCCRYQYGLAFDGEPDADDTVTEASGIRFVVDDESRPQCDGATIDFVETPKGAGFAVRGPVIEGAACGCGGGQHTA